MKTTATLAGEDDIRAAALDMAAAGRSAMDLVEPLKDKVSAAEWNARVDLAAAYRLVARHGWDDMLSTHISARVPDEDGAFLINPYGVLFHQVTASSLVKVDYDGNLLGDTPFLVNPAAIVFHAPILQARPDASSALHLHTTAGVAVATQEHGLLPITQRALYFLPILAYHDYEGIGLEDDERDSVARDLSNKWALILRNHGTLTVGRTIGQAYTYTYFLERACQYQIAALTGGSPLRPLDQDVIDLVPRQASHFEHAGLLEWPALLATLDADGADFRR